MKMIKLIGLILVLSVAALSGCGGGGGATDSGGTPATTQPTTATLKLSTEGTLTSGNSIGSLDLTLNLPAGVTIKADSNGQALDGVVTPSTIAAGSLAIATYTPADATNQAKVRIVMINATGFATGEFATVNCDIASGSTPVATDFSLTGLAVTNVDSVTIDGLTPTLTADIK